MFMGVLAVTGQFNGRPVVSVQMCVHEAEAELHFQEAAVGLKLFSFIIISIIDSTPHNLTHLVGAQQLQQLCQREINQ